jgi:hypothetical protein
MFSIPFWLILKLPSNVESFVEILEQARIESTTHEQGLEKR